MLVSKGRELTDNGVCLGEMGDKLEGRARVMAGLVIAEVGQRILMDARSEVLRREMNSIRKRIRAFQRAH
jgi:hypothetical protein